MSAPSRAAALLIALACVVPSAPAQDAALGRDEAKLLWVDGRPMLRVTLRAGDKVYYCHLLVDLSTSSTLLLHRNAAGSLRASACDIEAGGITLSDVPFEARRETWLEGLTAEYAEALQQVPVAGIVGLAAFGARDVVVDGPGARLRLLPQAAADAELPPSSPGLSTVPLVGNASQGWRVRAELGPVGATGGDAVAALLALHTRDPFSWLEPDLCRRAGHRDGVLARAELGPHLDLARWTPFRPLRGSAGAQGGIGGHVLQQMVVTLQPRAGRVVFAHAEAPVYPQAEADFYRAAFGSREPAALQQFLAQYPDAPQAAEAAAAWLERLLEGDGDADGLRDAGLAVVRAAPANQKGTAALDVLEKLPGSRAMFPARRAIAEAALAEARADEDGNATHKLRLELGTQLRILGDSQGARRHLLSAVFGMPVSGPANLQLGHWHRDLQQFEAALGRYFLAILDMRATGEAGFVAFAETFAKWRGEGADLLAELLDRADGRVPSFQPIPRDPATIQKTGRTVLVELFTGAMCPPCVAADLACDALGQLYDVDECVVVQWHLPVPAPEPMVAPVALARASGYEVSSTPTVVIAGGEPAAGGGRADAAPDLFRSYRERVDAVLQQPPVASVGGQATQRGDLVKATVQVEARGGADPTGWRLHAVLTEALVAFPGANGLLFHHHVARGALTPADGVAVGTGPHELQLDLLALRRELDGHVAQYEQEREFLVRPVRPDPRRLELVVFVQDRRGAVLQAARLPVAVEEAR